MGMAFSVQHLSVKLRGNGGGMILRDVSLDVPTGVIIGVVGGSGSGKTTIGLSMLGLLPSAMERISGELIFEGKNIADSSPEEWRGVRGARVSMAFQEPMSAFDPVMTIGAQIQETVAAHENLSATAARDRSLEALRLAGIGDPVRVASAYAFELSGGLRQRAMIAQAIVCRPALLIADEPTSSLDMATQDKILALFADLRRSMGLSILLITHDLGVVRRVADEVVVLCRGEVVEQGRVGQVLNVPRAESTKILLEADG